MSEVAQVRPQDDERVKVLLGEIIDLHGYLTVLEASQLRDAAKSAREDLQARLIRYQALTKREAA
jgi:hypothetical protein